ncbi:hypothetical protein Egran_04435 [Elaphomyces granulatus]|uniref:Aminoacyl-transfer RNA synthetases class-II family profile domain-containing protein n=1 Tax=Elaphomyces granulatus TaxID=519963 RepID=A0A232LUK4_9EURO|nr:hypothetical protein Egran_04435 [Elaphomyces granulatus]
MKLPADMDSGNDRGVLPALSETTFALHAGTTESWETNLPHQQAIEQVLGEITEIARASLLAGASALDVVETAVIALEDCPFFNAGTGAALNEDARSSHRRRYLWYGAVAGVTRARNPVKVARAVMESGRHSFIFGPAADDFAKTAGLRMSENPGFTTPFRKSQWEAQSAFQAQAQDSGTVGAVALDVCGRIAAAGSTGGMTCKAKGRLGDTAVMAVGAGMTYSAKRLQVEFPFSKHRSLSKMPWQRWSTISVVGRLFWTATCSSSEPVDVSLVENTIPIFPQHIFYEDAAVSAGFTRYPIAPGQVIITTPGSAPIMSLDISSFRTFLKTVRGLAVAIRGAVSAEHCGLVTSGDSFVLLIPFPGLKTTGIPIYREELEYYAVYPGYLSSKNGPQMDRSLLDSLQRKIAAVTGLIEPFNDQTDKEHFACLIRGERLQWRIWENKTHVAFLTPTGQTPGCAVVVPRKHIGPDVLLLNDEDYENILTAVYSVAQAMKKALGVRRCGMFFEGFEGDYAHVKLIPVHEPSPEQRKEIPVRGPAAFSDTYQGFLTTQLGPLALNLDELTKLATKIRELTHQRKLIEVPKSWQHPESHTLNALQSAWYTTMFRMQSTMYHEAINIFYNGLGYEYAIVPVTSHSISSPMGLGSDSEPVAIKLDGLDAYLADSQQFILEYILRLQNGPKGVYYVGTSCRGEDADATHVNQFCHFECELLGTLDNGIEAAERFIIQMTETLLKKHSNEIVAYAGTIAHIQDVLRLWRFRGGGFPRISLDEALDLPEMTQEMWRYVVPEKPELGRSLTRKGELRLIRKFGGALWLTEMDHQSVPFYQAYSDGNRTKACCADFLIGPGEVIGCGCRHRTAEDVIESLSRHEVDAKAYSWYIDMRRLKEMETVGWGVGIERYLCWIMQHDDIRDIQLVPRLRGKEYAL